MKKLTLDIIGDSAFGYKFNALSDHPDVAVKAYKGALDAEEVTPLRILAMMFPVCVGIACTRACKRVC